MTENESKAVNELHEAIMDELRAEPVAVQIKVAFAVLVTAINDGARREPAEMRRATIELQQLMSLVQ